MRNGNPFETIKKTGEGKVGAGDVTEALGAEEMTQEGGLPS